LCLVSVIFESDLMTFSFFTVFVSVVVRYWTVVLCYLCIQCIICYYTLLCLVF